MAEFTLPKNSKVGTGKTHPPPANAKQPKRFNIYRWNPDDGKNPVVDTYTVDLAEIAPTVLVIPFNRSRSIDPTWPLSVSTVFGTMVWVCSCMSEWICGTVAKSV